MHKRVAYMIAMGNQQAHDMMRYFIDIGAPRDWEYQGLYVRTQYLMEYPVLTLSCCIL